MGKSRFPPNFFITSTTGDSRNTPIRELQFRWWDYQTMWINRRIGGYDYAFDLLEIAITYPLVRVSYF